VELFPGSRAFVAGKFDYAPGHVAACSALHVNIFDNEGVGELLESANFDDVRSAMEWAEHRSPQVVLQLNGHVYRSGKWHDNPSPGELLFDLADAEQQWEQIRGSFVDYAPQTPENTQRAEFRPE
jgi:hypothetical protein